MPRLGARASPGRAWRLWAVWHSQEAAEPSGGAPPLPEVHELYGGPPPKWVHSTAVPLTMQVGPHYVLTFVILEKLRLLAR